MEDIRKIQNEINVLSTRLREHVVKYVESKGTISFTEDCEGEIEPVDVYYKDGVIHEANIKTISVSDGILWISVRDYYTSNQDKNVEVSEGMLSAVIGVLKYDVQINGQETSDDVSDDYPMLYVNKSDLEAVGFDVTNVTDETMQELAVAMADCYSDDEFLDYLKSCAKDLNIPSS